MSADQPPVQLRIGFTGPSRPVTVTLGLAGLSVLVDAEAGQFDEVWGYLSGCGADPTVTDEHGIRFPVARLGCLAELPPQVRVRCDDVLAPLYLLATSPSADGLPATLTVEPGGSLRLSWFDGMSNRDETFDPAAAAALLNAELPFEATTEAWAVLKSACQLPVLVGRARMNLDGFVELTVTTSAQLLETAPLPGLFRIDETHFGLALPYVAHVDANPGFVWDGHRPVLERGPAVLPALPVSLSAHAHADLRAIVDQLAAYRAQAVVWEPGLGRRVFALAAVQALDAWPLLIVTPPSAVWLWQRHLDLFGRSYALTHDRADVHIVTYRDLAVRAELPSPQAVIFDSLAAQEAASPALRTAVHRLDGVADCYRVAIDAVWPEHPGEQVEVMSVLRPGEFRADVPLARRYPVSTEQRVSEHVRAYLSRRTVADTGPAPSGEFRRSSTVAVSPTEAQHRALTEAAERYRDRTSWADPVAQLAEMLEIVSAGPPHAVSPKVAATVARARAAHTAGRRVAVLTRHVRTATLVAATLRPVQASVFDAAEGPVPADVAVAVVRFDRSLPNLRSFDEVIVVDYPWSTELLERAIGAASDTNGPAQVTVVHMVGTLDDRLAMLAARRRERGALTDPQATPSAAEVDYLLAARPA